MEIIYSFVVLSFATTFGILAWRVLNWVWLKPKKLEKILRQQGFKGNSYRFLFGDTKEIDILIREANSKPINLSDDIVPRLIPHFHECIKKYGKKSFLWLGPTPWVLVTDPEHIREILSKKFCYMKLPGNPLTRLLATGLASADGQKWAKHRKILNPAFHFEKLKDMLPAFQLSCNEMISNWEKMIGAKGLCEVDVWPHLQTFTSDVISRTAFGSSFEQGRKIFELQKEQTELMMQAARQIYVPGLRFLPTWRNSRMKEIAKQVKDSVNGIINRRMKALEAGEAAKDDLLGILLESNLKEMQQHGNKNFGLSTEEVIEECKLFYFAGQETASTLLVWTMILLSKHQNWQSSARDEVLQIFGHATPDFDGLNNLKIVTMIFNEVLRLYTPAVALQRTTNEEAKLGEITLPVGVKLSLQALLLHHDHKLWGGDAKEFKPERFSEGISKATNGQFSFFPFGGGSRICIGQNFAMLEAKMAIAMILQHFSFELSPSYTHAPRALVTVQPQHGAHLILQKL